MAEANSAAKILVVDDQPQNLRLLVQLLTENGYYVRGANSGKMALQFVQKELPDLVLLDIRMPEMDGFEVCSRLKADEHTKDVPVIFLSALTDTVDKIKGLNIGAVDYVAKPIDLAELLARVRTHISLHSLQVRLKKINISLERQIEERTRKLTETNEMLYKEIQVRKGVQEALEKSEKKYHRLFDSMMDAFVLFDMDGNIIDFNESYRAMLGFSREELCALSNFQITPSEWYDFEQKLFNNQTLIRGHSDVFEKEYRRKNGSVFPVELRIFLIKEGKEKNVGMWAIVRDITERKEAKTNLEVALKEKDILLEELYHRTKNNMQVIIAFLQMHAMFSEDESIQRIFGEMENRIRLWLLSMKNCINQKSCLPLT